MAYTVSGAGEALDDESTLDNGLLDGTTLELGTGLLELAAFDETTDEVTDETLEAITTLELDCATLLLDAGTTALELTGSLLGATLLTAAVLDEDTADELPGLGVATQPASKLIAPR